MNPETMEATRQWMSDLQLTDADRIAAVFGENEISLANLHHFSREELTSLGISKQDATTIRRASTAANDAAHAEPNHTLPSNVAELDRLVCPQCGKAFQSCPGRKPMKLKPHGCEHSICHDCSVECSEGKLQKCPVAQCNRVYPEDPRFFVNDDLMQAVTLTERLAQSASATPVSVSPQCALGYAVRG